MILNYEKNKLWGNSSVSQGRWGGGVTFSEGKRYGGVMFNVISGTRGWVGVHCLNDPYVYDVKGMILNVLFGVLVYGCVI